MQYKLYKFLPLLLLIVTITVPAYSQRIPQRRGAPMPYENPVKPSTQPAKGYNPPSGGIQNPTAINGQTPMNSSQTVPTAPVLPQSPFVNRGTNPFQPNPAAGTGIPQTASQPIVQRNPFQPAQGSYRPVQAATIGQAVKPQTSAKPFDNVAPQSPYSPYMYLYAGRGGLGTVGDNYNLFVRPIQQQKAYDQNINREVESLQNTLLRQQRQLETQNRTLNQIEENNPGLLPTQSPLNSPNPYGGSPYFMNDYQRYFNTRGSNNY